jgi:hypothetical protein
MGGFLILRKKNVYQILGPGAAMVQAEMTATWINIQVFLGQMINKEVVRGLLGSVSGHSHDLAMSDGTVLHNPPSYAEFTRYADSWRVEPAASLLCDEGKVSPGMPQKPISAGDLTPAERMRVVPICLAAGVHDDTLQWDCALDVSLSGDNSAANAFLSVPSPTKTIRPTFP